MLFIYFATQNLHAEAIRKNESTHVASIGKLKAINTLEDYHRLLKLLQKILAREERRVKNLAASATEETQIHALNYILSASTAEVTSKKTNFAAQSSSFSKKNRHKVESFYTINTYIADELKNNDKQNFNSAKKKEVLIRKFNNLSNTISTKQSDLSTKNYNGILGFINWIKNTINSVFGIKNCADTLNTSTKKINKIISGIQSIHIPTKAVSVTKAIDIPKSTLNPNTQNCLQTMQKNCDSNSSNAQNGTAAIAVMNQRVVTTPPNTLQSSSEADQTNHGHENSGKKQIIAKISKTEERAQSKMISDWIENISTSENAPWANKN